MFGKSQYNRPSQSFWNAKKKPPGIILPCGGILSVNLNSSCGRRER
jgi:hypothetical protein